MFINKKYVLGLLQNAYIFTQSFKYFESVSLHYLRCFVVAAKLFWCDLIAINDVSAVKQVNGWLQQKHITSINYQSLKGSSDAQFT